MLSFLKHVLPTAGWYCITVFRGKSVSNRFFQTVEQATAFAEQEDEKSDAVYFAVASYKTSDSRKQENVQGLRSVWADIDGGEDAVSKRSGYVDADAGHVAVCSFCRDVGIPAPTFVASGTGLHCHWTFTRDIAPVDHKKIAELLKRAMAAHGLLFDPARALDCASILRPPGTHNRKGLRPVLVRCGDLARPIDPEELESALLECLSNKLPSLAERCRAGTSEGQPRSSHAIVERCQQIKPILFTPGRVSEPLWHAIVGVFHFIDDGAEFLFEATGAEWHGEIRRRLAQVEKLSGATTCERFEALNPEGCKGCPHKSKIKTPAALGYESSDRPEGPVFVAAPDLPGNLPDGFEWDNQKLVYTKGAVKGSASTLVSEHPIYLKTINRSEITGEHSFTFKLKFPLEKDKIVSMDARTFWGVQGLSEMSRFGSNVHDGDLFRKYMRLAIDKFYASEKLTTQYEQYGWKEGGAFLCGNTLYKPDGTTEEAQSISELEVRNQWFGPGSGAKTDETHSLEGWIQAANKLFTRGCEAHAVVLLSAFASPLMCFCHPFEGGSIISLVTRASGKGKTQALAALASVWGSYKGLYSKRRSSTTAQFLLLSYNGNLPIINDEIAIGDPSIIRDWIKSYTEGWDKDRATRDGQLIHIANGWQNILTTSSNSSLFDLMSEKDKGAEARVIEFNPTLPPEIAHEFGDTLIRDLLRNGGYAGDVYLRYIVKPEVRAWIKDSIEKLMVELWRRCGLPADYRFWIRTLAAVSVAAKIVQGLGLLSFSADDITEWFYKQLMSKPLSINDTPDSPLDEDWPLQQLGLFVASIRPKTLVIDGEFKINHFLSIREYPRDICVARYETATERLTVAFNELQAYASKNELPFREWCAYLEKVNIMGRRRKVIVTSGTHLPGTAIFCVELELKRKLVSKDSNIVQLRKGDER